MKLTVIYSVMHTGTTFTQKFLENLGYTRAWPASIRYHDEESSLYYQLHALPDSVVQLDKFGVFDKAKIVVPIRHPHDCYFTHLLRSRIKLDHVVNSWNILIEQLDGYDYCCMPVQLVNNVDRVQSLIRVTGYLEVDGCGEIVNEYASKWLPLRAHQYSDSEKQKLLELKQTVSSTPIQELDFAVKWYEERMESLNQRKRRLTDL